MTGDTIAQIRTGDKSVADVHDEASRALNSPFVIRLVDGTEDVARMVASEIRGPLGLIKLRCKGLQAFSVHSILRQMGTMEGSRNAGRLVAMVHNDPDELHPFASYFYGQLFGTSTTEGYIVQARMMHLHTIITSVGELPAEDVVLSRLGQIRREDAIHMLIDMHNQGDITVCRTRFRPLAESLNFHLR